MVRRVDAWWLLVAVAGCRQLLGFDEPDVVVHDARDDDAPAVDAYIPDSGPCQALGAECAAPMLLRACTILGQPPIDTTCGWGCIASPSAHCGRLAPAGGVATSADLDLDPGIQDVAFGAVTVNTDDGSISGVRPPGPGIRSGIGFEARGGGGVFRFGTLRLDAGAIVIVGTRPAVFAALRGVELVGSIDVTGGCTGTAAGPGGGAGGQPAAKGANGLGSTIGGGPAGGQGGNDVSGGGGGGYGGDGGPGGSPGASPMSAGGLAYGAPAIPALTGGAGGGGGGGAAGGTGGGGGGALQIASNGALAVNGTIHAGGCGGDTGNQSGGGGGAGGTILLEAPVITLAPVAILAANGGAAAGGAGTGGEDAKLSSVRASGGLGANGGDGGRGGGGSVAAGETGKPGSRNGGGGGGGVGRIRLTTQSGSATGSATASPALTQSTAIVQ